jgi:very-short-patch-repair endonuclease
MKTILSNDDILEIISLYQNQIPSTHKLAEKFKVGHKKISQILKNNNIKINKKGGQVKDFQTLEIESVKTKKYETDEYEFVAVCKKTKITINDPNNLSGKLTKHIIENYGDVNIPINNYQRKKYEIQYGKKWYEEYFDIIKKEKKEIRKCSLCKWETTDINNKTGCFEQHIIKTHNITIKEYLDEFPLEYKFHPTLVKKSELNKSENIVVCQICNEKMKSITNTHLKNKHNMDIEEYKIKFPNSKIVSETTSKKLSESTKILNQTLEPTWTSKGESEIKEFLETLGFDVVKGKNRKILEGKEIDLIIPSLKICFEYDGLYYHTEKMGKDSKYHLNKTIDCFLMGYKLYHIYEDEWVKNKELVKNKIKHILNKNDGIKIGARQVKIKNITKEQKTNFLNDFHIQGNDKSDIFYGAFYGDTMVGIMTFNRKRNMTKTQTGEFELSRYSTNSGFIVNGLASKILKKFIKEHNPKQIISFADRRWTISSENNLYTKLGFKLTSVVKPSYYYYSSKINKYKRFHKFSMGKNNLKKKYPNLDFTKSESQLTEELGFDKIWNCGLFKYVLDLNI